MDAMFNTSATALARAIRARSVSVGEVVAAYIERIAAVNPAINAVVQLAGDAALDDARRADAVLARGDAVGPLHGVPFTAKDVFDTAGLITAVGLVERADYVPERDATVVARMRAAGAILLGKTNCPPSGGGGRTDNPVYGRTNNPYDLARTPAGSSGGEAAIVAAGGSPLGIGSDSGGSIRLPAHFCGIAGLKPTTGRVPNSGAYAHPGGLSDPRTQIGPLSRFVDDLWTAFAVIAGPDWQDSGVVPMPLGDPESVSLSGLRLAWYADDGAVTPTDDTIQTVRATAAALAGAGLVVHECVPPDIAEAWPITKEYWGMRRLSGAEVEENVLRWDRFRSRMLGFMQDYDALLCPVDHAPAVLHEDSDEDRFTYTLPFSLTGWPCVVVRAGTSAEGLPIGVQIVARPWREDVALAIAREVERQLGGWRPPDL
jgi:amidase